MPLCHSCLSTEEKLILGPSSDVENEMARMVEGTLSRQVPLTSLSILEFSRKRHNPEKWKQGYGGSTDEKPRKLRVRNLEEG
jgi:hypothetical protein